MNRGGSSNTYYDYSDNHQSRWQQTNFETSLPSDLQNKEMRLLTKSR